MQPLTKIPPSVAKKRAALNIFSAPPFRRNIPQPKQRAEILRELKKKLLAGKFGTLPEIGLHQEVRLFSHNGTTVVVKNTRGDDFSGYTKRICNAPAHKFLKAHHAYYRSNKLGKKMAYILRTPRLLGRIGNYIIMEHITRWHPQTREEGELLALASDQVEDVSQNVAASTMRHKLQTEHFIPAGIHNEKIVMYAVYDYV